MSNTTPINNRIPPRRIHEVAAELGLDPDTILPHGHYIAKIPFDELKRRAGSPDGDLVLVTAMTPTPTGEGKTTTMIGLGDDKTTSQASASLAQNRMGELADGVHQGLGQRMLATDQDEYPLLDIREIGIG